MRYIVLSLLIIFIFAGVQAQPDTDDNCPLNLDDYLTPRLTVGEQARVAFDIALNVRPQPTLSQARIASLTGGEFITIVDGPHCADGFIWWQIETDDLSGWVAEGSVTDETYFIDPRGELILVEDLAGRVEPYIRTESGFLEPQGCARPPEDYERVRLGFATLNQRTLFMLDNAQRIYEVNGGEWANFRWLITQGSYNPGGVSASFGTHDAGGAVDISVIDTQDGWRIMREEVAPMLRALRIAGFAAWLRDTDELYNGSIIHIHAIAIGDAEASDIAQQQVSGEFGYFFGFNGLPPDEGEPPTLDIYGDPIICEWMVELGFSDLAD